MTNSDFEPLNPGDTIGIIGGGQLGRMLAMAAAKLGLKTIILEPGKDCPASEVAVQTICAPYDDPAALKELVKSCKVITWEFENIPLDAVNFLKENTLLRPNPLALEKSQDRLTEKQFINDLGIATAPYYRVDTIEDIKQGLDRFGSDAILKTRRFGYDGKGQSRLSKQAKSADISAAFDALGRNPSILEGFVTFSREISIIVGRSTNGDIRCYDPAENAHTNGILHTSTLPANITPETRNAAVRIAEKIVTALDYIGVMGVEFFVTPTGDLIVNEIAPRVHNSGHWTEAACAASQFEQHVRAVSGWPLADPTRHSDCVMENLIGDDVNKMPQLLTLPDVSIHLYGKAESRAGRKMGHFTQLSS